MDNLNNKRIFSNLVAVEIDCDKITESNKETDLMLYMSFNEARLGGNPNDKVSFKVQVHKAECFIIVGEEIEKNENIMIDKNSILRTNPSHEKEIEEGAGQSNQKIWGGVLRLKKAVGLDINTSRTDSSQETIKKTYKAGSINYTYHPISKNQLGWILTPEAGSSNLQGSVWNGSQKMLKLIDKRIDPKHILASVKLIIECRRDDLRITNIKYSNPASRIKNLSTTKKSLAIEVIKNTLIEYKLADKNSDISQDYAIIRLADILVETE